MNVIEKTPTRLVIGGWKTGAFFMAAALLGVPIGMYLLMVRNEPATIWMNLFAAVICAAILFRMVFREKITFDAEKGEAVFDQRLLLRRKKRQAALTPVSRVEIDSHTSSDNRPRRRLVLVTGHERTPFTKLYSGGKFDKEQALLNDWLQEVFANTWREDAARLRAAPRAESDEDVPEGIRRVRHPATGLTIDVPRDWSASVSEDKSGPLTLFGVTLLQRLDRPGPKRGVDDGAPWNTLLVGGAEDAGLKLTVHDGPLTQTLTESLEGPWSKQWGAEVLQTEPEVEIGSMRGFSVARHIPAGATVPTFGKVSEPCATRQLWLGGDNLHVEVVGLARRDHPDIQHAIDAMFASIRGSGPA